jgi:hypothetical protein
MGPYIIGIMLGHLIYIQKTKKKFKIKFVNYIIINFSKKFIDILPN